MRTRPEHGEDSCVGKGLLEDKAALITGGDSGIDRAVAIAYPLGACSSPARFAAIATSSGLA